MPSPPPPALPSLDSAAHCWRSTLLCAGIGLCLSGPLAAVHILFASFSFAPKAYLILFLLPFKTHCTEAPRAQCLWRWKPQGKGLLYCSVWTRLCAGIGLCLCQGLWLQCIHYLQLVRHFLLPQRPIQYCSFCFSRPSVLRHLC
jgi:hypothetical protein